MNAAKWSDREVAKRAGVGHVFVNALRKQLFTENSSAPRRGADGKTRKLPAKPAPKWECEIAQMKKQLRVGGLDPQFRSSSKLGAEPPVIGADGRGGELLRAMQLKKTERGGGGHTGKGKRDPTSPLRDLGLTPSESKRMQAAAAVPEKVRRIPVPYHAFTRWGCMSCKDNV